MCLFLKVGLHDSSSCPMLTKLLPHAQLSIRLLDMLYRVECFSSTAESPTCCVRSSSGKAMHPSSEARRFWTEAQQLPEVNFMNYDTTLGRWFGHWQYALFCLWTSSASSWRTALLRWVWIRVKGGRRGRRFAEFNIDPYSSYRRVNDRLLIFACHVLRGKTHSNIRDNITRYLDHANIDH